jgi:hypothetical protein
LKKCRVISHRGNLTGPEPERENTLSFIDEAIAAGFDVEIDVRCLDEKFYLGHDGPDRPVTHDWLSDRREHLWIHCKNLTAYAVLAKAGFQCFCHNDDPFVAVSTGHIWLHDLGLGVTEQCIIPLINREETLTYSDYEPHGICTDYPTLIP